MLGLFLRRTFAECLVPLKPNNIFDNFGARYKFKKLGRGRASGKGKTSCRGHKGQKAREGRNVHPSFEGGQSSLTIRIPKWGMNRTYFKKPLDPLNFSKLYYYIDKGRIDAEKPITMKTMFEAGVFSKIKHGVKLLSGGLSKIDRPLHFEVTDATKKAIDAIKAKGGSVTLFYKTDKQLDYHVKPYKFDLPMREFAMPPPSEAVKWKAKEDLGATLKYIKPSWLDEYKAPVVPQIPKFIRKPKPVVVRKIDYGLKATSN